MFRGENKLMIAVESKPELAIDLEIAAVAEPSEDWLALCEMIAEMYEREVPPYQKAYECVTTLDL
jgi:hypothetical protein